MAEVVLRPAVVGDTEPIATVYLAARDASPMPAGIHPEPEVRAWIGTRLASDEVWVAEVGGAVAAYARMTATWLEDLYVAPPYAGQGLGSALLDLVKARLPGGFCLWVFESNTPAQGFYRARGLVDLERTDGRDNEEREPDIKMAWPGEHPVAFYRSLIDEVDDQLGDLLARRAALTRAVQHARPGGGRDAERERRVALHLAERAPALGPDRLARIVDAIITESIDAATAPAGVSPGTR